MKKDISSVANLISLGNYAKALSLNKELLEIDPSNPNLLKLSIHIYSLTESFSEGLLFIEEIFKKFPRLNDYDFFNNYGYFLMKNEDYEKAIDYLNKAIKIDKSLPFAYSNLAEINLALRNFHDAKNFIDQAISKHIEKNESFTAFFHALSIKANINTALKNNKDSIDDCNKYLDKFFLENIFYLLSTIDPSKIKDRDVKKAEEQLKNNHQQKTLLEKYEKNIPLHFGLANYYEKIDSVKSEKYFHSANQEINDILRFRLYDYQKKIFDIIEVYENSFNENNKIEKPIGEKNFFIVGSPRSGTSLLESIVSSNKDVFAGGELSSFQDLVSPLTNKEANLDHSKIIFTAKQKYLERTLFMKKDFEYIVDKFPGNFLYLGFIQKILPSSKIIRIYRDPWDTAISLYKQKFAKTQPYSSSFFNLGVFFANFEAINRYWDNHLERDKILDIHYENLVKNEKNQQEKIYQFLGITAAFEKEKRKEYFAKTASIQQVQENVHTRSIKKIDFNDKKDEFFSAFNEQRKFWIKKGFPITENSDFFGYKIS